MYAIFYAANVLLEKENLSSSKHSGVLAAMKTELMPGTTSQQRQAVLDFARQLRVAKGDRVVKVLLIGSVARGDFGADSDIDVAVVARSVDTSFKWDVWGIGAQVSLRSLAQYRA